MPADQAAPGNCAGKSARGVADFVAHHRGEFEADQTEADDAERIENEARVGGNFEVGSSDGGTEARPDHYAQADQNCGGDESADGAEVVDPLADAQAEDVEQGEERQQAQATR